MRVTKTIREYIESEVSKKYEHYCDAEQKACKELRDEVEAFMKDLEAECEQKIQKRFGNKFRQNGMDSGRFYGYPRVEAHYGTDQSDLNLALAEKERKLRHIKEKKVYEIVLSLEMGGDKQMLMDLLSAVNPDESGEE